jgi:hypothetical protein
LNAWTNLYGTRYVYHGTWANLSGVPHKSLPSVCVFLRVSLLSLPGNEVKTFPQQRRIVGGVVFYAVRVVSNKRKRRVLPRTSRSCVNLRAVQYQTENVYRQTEGWLMNCKGLGRKRLLCDVLSRYLHGGTEENISVSTGDVQPRIEQSPSRIPVYIKLYRYANLLHLNTLVRAQIMYLLGTQFYSAFFYFTPFPWVTNIPLGALLPDAPKSVYFPYIERTSSTFGHLCHGRQESLLPNSPKRTLRLE